MNTPRIISTGQAAALLQQLPVKIAAAASEIGVSPAMVINGVDHYAESDIEKIRERLRPNARERLQRRSTNGAPLNVASGVETFQ